MERTAFLLALLGCVGGLTPPTHHPCLLTSPGLLDPPLEFRTTTNIHDVIFRSFFANVKTMLNFPCLNPLADRLPYTLH